jgi:hypothetical protein
MRLRLVKDKASKPATPATDFPGVLIDTTAGSSLRIADVHAYAQNGNEVGSTQT